MQERSLESWHGPGKAEQMAAWMIVARAMRPRDRFSRSAQEKGIYDCLGCEEVVSLYIGRKCLIPLMPSVNAAVLAAYSPPELPNKIHTTYTSTYQP